MSSVKCLYFTLLFRKYELACESMKGTNTEKGLHYWGFHGFQGIVVPHHCSRHVLHP